MIAKAALVWATLVAVQQVDGATGKTLPPYLKVCRRHDPHLEKCVASAIETLRPYLKKGIPDVGVPPCEPLFIPEVVIKQGKGAITLTTNYSNIQVSGASQFQLKTVRVDVDHNILLVRMRLPSLQLVSNYSIYGRFLLLPISGGGVSHSNYTDIDVTGSIQSERYVRDNETFWLVDDFFLDFEIGDAVIHMAGLVGDKEVGAALNRFINENWRGVAEDIKPSLEKTIGDMFKEVANNIFHQYSMDQLLPV